MKDFIFKGDKTKEISFPLGGIGAGCIGLSGNGRLIDWEIFNRPNKGSVNGFSHFSIKAESGNKLIDARILNGDLHAPYTGMYNDKKYAGYGFGPDRSTLAGLPHFQSLNFEGEFPIAKLMFNDDAFPGSIVMTAFNPFIPLNDKDSSIPAAFFEFEVKNTTKETLNYTINLSMGNPHIKGTTINQYSKNGDIHMITHLSDSLIEDDINYGEVTIATSQYNVSYQEYWYRGEWFDNLEVYWKDFTSSNKFVNRTYDSKNKNSSQEMSSLAAHVSIKPDSSKLIRFVISWNYPNCKNSWNLQACDCSATEGCGTAAPEGCGETEDYKTSVKKEWRNYYSTIFSSSRESAIYSLSKWDTLYKETSEFKNALFSSSLPIEALDAVSANISILKTPTCLRLQDGSFYGFEGCHCNEGCCEGSCTHVWNYAYALPFLFPKLERSMRDLDFNYNQRDDGSMCFRLQLPVGRERSAFRACADGQFGGVIKAYRDWKICGDIQWLKSNWEAIKKSIEFAWADTNEDKWDINKTGVLYGRQHHTLDMELFGANSWLTGFYLGALKAGAEMAEYLGESDKSKEYLDLFDKGSAWVNDNLFNGEYFYQLINLSDKAILEKYCVNGSDDSTIKSYWNDEAKEIKYQIGEGCGVDQVVAQWHANICGLGNLFDKQKTLSSLKSIYKYNFKKRMRNYFNPCRLYCLNDEAGVVICNWPKNKYKPVIPVPYSQETMNGFEYQAACHLIREGFVNEGMEIVSAIRQRYDGEKRNPWNEFECGSNYARSMASYDLLLAFSGFEFDMAKGMIGFNPIQGINNGYSSFWSIESGWGTFSIEGNIVKLKVLYEKLDLKVLKLPFVKNGTIKCIMLGTEKLRYQINDNTIEFEDYVTINKGETLNFLAYFTDSKYDYWKTKL